MHPISDLQIEYSLLSRGLEQQILPTARELGIGVSAYGVLSRGLLSGHWSPEREISPADFRAISPRFQGDNLEHNLELVERLREVADDQGATVAQVAIAWVLTRGDDVVALVGARRRDRLTELSARSSSSSARPSSPGSRTRFRSVPPRATATPTSRWLSLTASAERGTRRSRSVKGVAGDSGRSARGFGLDPVAPTPTHRITKSWEACTAIAGQITPAQRRVRYGLAG